MMGDVPMEPDKERDDLQKKLKELEERRKQIRDERTTLAFGRSVWHAILISSVLVVAFFVYTAIDNHYRLEKARIDAEAAGRKAELELQARRLDMEREQLALQRRNEALRHLAAVLEGPGTQAEKQRSFQLLLTFYISIDVLPKAADKLAEWASIGIKGLGNLLAALKEGGSSQCGCRSGCVVTCPCGSPPPPRKPAARKPPVECKPS
jgi:hypothetical protein